MHLNDDGSRLNAGFVAAAVAIALLAISGLFGACGSGDDAPNGSTATSTPARLTGAPDITAGRAALAGKSAELAAFVSNVESAKIDAVVETFQFDARACEAFATRGVTECESRKVPPGTVLQVFRREGFEGYGIERADVTDAMRYFLTERHPRLSFAADRSDGSTILLFAIDPKPGLIFPGALPEGGANVVAVYFWTAPGKPSSTVSYGYQSAATPPLEFLHYDERSGLTYKILGVDAQYRARDADSFATIEALSGRR